jgi:hypothetical protein
VPIKFKKPRQSGKFVISEREIYGELTLAGAATELYLHDKDFFSTHDIRGRWIRGALHDFTKVSLIDCVAPSAGTVNRGDEAYHYASIFPNFVVHGDHHLNPDDNVITSVEFLIDDANSLFCDYDAFGWLPNAQPFIEQIASAGQPYRRVAAGPDAQIIYFTGKSEVFSVKTALGTVSGIQKLLRRSVLHGHSRVCVRNFGFGRGGMGRQILDSEGHDDVSSFWPLFSDLQEGAAKPKDAPSEAARPRLTYAPTPVGEAPPTAPPP